MQSNPDRDYAIIAARKHLADTQAELAAKKSPYAALVVQDARQRWDRARKLTLVKGTEQ